MPCAAVRCLLLLLSLSLKAIPVVLLFAPCATPARIVIFLARRGIRRHCRIPCIRAARSLAVWTGRTLPALPPSPLSAHRLDCACRRSRDSRPISPNSFATASLAAILLVIVIVLIIVVVFVVAELAWSTITLDEARRRREVGSEEGLRARVRPDDLQ
jgi:hypothetical protein